MNNGISSKAPEKEQIKSDFECLIRGMNSTGMIDCIAYDDLFDEAMPMFDRMFEQGKKEAITWHPYPEEKPKQLTSYLVTVRLPTVGSYRTVLFYAVRSPAIDMWGLDRSGSQGRVVAWAEIPDAYEPKEGEAEWLQPKLI